MIGKSLRPFAGSAALGASLLFAQPAAAQDIHQHWAYCNNQDRRFPADVVIRGCTAIIESGGSHKRSLTIAYTSRGNAYLRAGITDKAILDFNRAIEINAELATGGKHPVDKSERAAADPTLFDLDRVIQLKPEQIASYYRKRAGKLAPTDRGDEHIEKSNTVQSAAKR